MSSGFPWAISKTQGLENLSNILVMPKFIMTTQYYIGLDVHKDTIAIAYISSQSREDATYH